MIEREDGKPERTYAYDAYASAAHEVFATMVTYLDLENKRALYVLLFEDDCNFPNSWTLPRM